MCATQKFPLIAPPYDEYLVEKSASPNGELLIVVCSRNRDLCVVDAITREVVSRCSIPTRDPALSLGIVSVSWHPCGTIVAAVDVNRLIILDALKGRIIDSSNDGYYFGDDICYHPQGRFIACSSGYGGIIKILDTSLFGLPVSYKTRVFSVMNSRSGGAPVLSWHPEGHLLAIGSTPYSAFIFLWTFRTRTDPECISLKDAGVEERIDGITRDLAWHPGGSIIVSVTDSGMATVWDIRTRSVLYMLHATSTTVIRSVSWHPDGIHLICQLNGYAFNELCIWDMKTGTFGHGYPLYKIRACEIKNNGRLFVYSDFVAPTSVYIFEETASPDASKTVENALVDCLRCEDEAKIVLSFL